MAWVFLRKPSIRKALKEYPAIAEAVEFAAAVTGEDPFVLAAIAERESLYGRALDAQGRGDGGRAYGVFQVDERYHREFVESGGWRDPTKSAVYAAKLLAANREALGGPVALEFGPEMVERAVIAAYNASVNSVLRGLREARDPDKYTTGGNYSRDVLARAARLRERGR